jgi:YafQ family addiction module toxin component
MPFDYDYHEDLEAKLEKIHKRDKPLYDAVAKKIKEVISRDNATIDAYKNLRHEMNDCKRVHIHRSFVLLFKVFKKKNFVLFYRLEHHDNVYI